MQDDDLTLSIGLDGTISFIYSDEFVDLIDQAKTIETKRASHVEPIGKYWVIFFEDKEGTTVGPFRTREEALAVEVSMLEEKMFT